MRIKAFSLLLLVPALASAEDYRITTIAGFGTFGGDGGPATAALVNPAAVAVDTDGTLYVSDSVNYRIRKIDHSGTITTLIGKGYGGFSGDGGPASAAAISTAFVLALDAAGNLYFTDYYNFRIREVTIAGIVKTVAGNGTCGTTKAGVLATQAPLCDVESVGVDGQGRIYFASSGQIWMVAADGALVLVAGTGGPGKDGDGGLATAAQIGFPNSIAFDQSGNLYFADAFNLVIREVTTDKRIGTLVHITDLNASGITVAVDTSGTLFYSTGTVQVFKLVQGAPAVVATLTGANRAQYVAIDRTGALYLASPPTQRLLKANGANTTVIAGAYPYDLESLPKPATSVHLQLNSVLAGLAVDAGGNVYFPELDGDLFQRIDKVTPSGVMSALNTPQTLQNHVNFGAHAVAVGPSGLIYFSTFSQVYRLESNGTLTLIAGAPGIPTALGDGGPATAAMLSPTALAFDQSGNLYIAESFASRVRKVAQNIITTFAGTGHGGNTGDGGLAAAATLLRPVDVKVDSNGNVYIADLIGAVVRKVDSHGIITTVAGNGTSGFSGDGGSATKAQLSGAAAIALDPSGNLFIADRASGGGTITPLNDNNRIRMVNPSGTISTVAGGFPGYNGEGVLSTLAAMGSPVALATDAQGNLYVEEVDTQRVRKLTPAQGAPSVTSVLAADFSAALAPESIAAAFGTNLAIGTAATQSLPLPTKLGGVSLTVKDSAGTTRMAPLFYVSPAQINFEVPQGTAAGLATVEVANGAVTPPTGTAAIQTVAPGLFTANGNGKGVPAATAVRVLLPGQTQTPVAVYQCTAGGGCAAVPIEEGIDTPVYLTLYGTGIRNRSSLSGVTCTVGGLAANVLYAGPQGTLAGLDQVNIGLPLGLMGKGLVDIVLTVDGHVANTVQVDIK